MKGTYLVKAWQKYANIINVYSLIVARNLEKKKSTIMVSNQKIVTWHEI